MLRRREFLSGSTSLGLAALGGCAATPDTTAAETEEIRAALEQAVGFRASIAGMVAAVVDENGANMAAHGSTGVDGVALDAGTVFEIGSITKVMTALMLADMVERGEVAFDDPVTDYLPASATLQPRGRPITLLDLATYTSGLPRMPGNIPQEWLRRPNPLADFTTDMLFDALVDLTPEHEAGAHYEYANFGFALLGVALARRASTSYEQLLIERVCDPLGLDRTRITLTPDMQAHVAQGHNLGGELAQLLDMPGLQGAGAARADANDMVAFLEAAMGLRRTPLDAAFARLLETRRPTPLAGTDAALGWFVSSDGNEEIVWKSGATSGFGSCLAFSTRSRRGAFVLSNFLWRKADGAAVDAGLVDIATSLINPDFRPGDIMALYR
jgi:CubicO group peptidase (beta-lactamase class C family)